MSCRISCWKNGHDWSLWQIMSHKNVFGVLYDVRYCKQCGAIDKTRS
jgi:hypothetical protein